MCGLLVSHTASSCDPIPIGKRGDVGSGAGGRRVLIGNYMNALNMQMFSRWLDDDESEG